MRKGVSRSLCGIALKKRPQKGRAFTPAKFTASRCKTLPRVTIVTCRKASPICGLYWYSDKKSVREPCSALSAPSRENLAAVSCGHSLHKAVFFFSVQLFGLICSFHFFSSFCCMRFRQKTPIALIILYFHIVCQGVIENLFKKIDKKQRL